MSCQTEQPNSDKQDAPPPSVETNSLCQSFGVRRPPDLLGNTNSATPNHSHPGNRHFDPPTSHELLIFVLLDKFSPAYRDSA
mmetsp:Transcript_34719/g.102060  ORF Transcript_34719/g.102060 Transcript_34719/m.102060 type:complete len:82 (-) Transcript_34719:754-999(-)